MVSLNIMLRAHYAGNEERWFRRDFLNRKRSCAAPILQVDCQVTYRISFCSLRGRRSKGKGKGIRARDRARGRSEEGPFPFSLARPNFPFPFPFKRLPSRLRYLPLLIEMSTGIRTVAEVRKKEWGLEPTEMEVTRNTCIAEPRETWGRVAHIMFRMGWGGSKIKWIV